MPRLTSFDRCELSDTAALRERRDLLLRKADRARFRLHRMPHLTHELQQATNELLKRELKAGDTSSSSKDALGDVGTVGGFTQTRLPYKDD